MWNTSGLKLKPKSKLRNIGINKSVMCNLNGNLIYYTILRNILKNQ